MAGSWDFDGQSLLRDITMLKGIYTCLCESMTLHLTKNDVPEDIQKFANDVLKKNLQKYSVRATGVYHADMPWHEADRTYTRMFKLMDNNRAYATEFSFSRSGLEGDGVVTGKEIKGEVNIPEGFVFVEVGTYPPRCDIYTAKGASLLPPPKQDEELSDGLLAVLHFAASLKSAYRPKFKEEVYQKLIDKGLLAKNRSITQEGRNILEYNKERLKKIAQENNEQNFSGHAGYKFGHHMDVY